MKRECKVLLLSTSTIGLNEGGVPTGLLPLIEGELQRRYPDTDWHCSADLLFVRPNMAQRARTLVERHTPDVAIVRPTGQAFMHDDVVSAVRDRWPSLYSFSVTASAFFRRLGGGQRWGGPGPRGLLFRFPRAVAARLVGIAPQVPVEAAIEYVKDALDTLLRLENLDVICTVSVGNTDDPLPKGEHDRRTNLFLSEIGGYCAGRKIPFSELRDVLRPRGIQYSLAADQYHPSMEPRAAEATMLAERVASVVGATPAGALPAKVPSQPAG